MVNINEFRDKATYNENSQQNLSKGFFFGNIGKNNIYI